MLLPNLLIYFSFFLPAILPRLLQRSQPNLPGRRQMGWNKKRMKLLKSVGGQIWGQKCHFLAEPAHTKCNMATKQGSFSETQRCLILTS